MYKLGQPYQVKGRWYYPEYDTRYDRVGTASWYGEPFHGRATANGERFDRKSVSAAHPTLPLPSLVRVVNLSNHREWVVRVNDRGPFVDDRLIDLSQEAARQLGFERQGLAPVRVQKKRKLTELQFGSGVGTKDLVTFTRLFATMIDAGLPLVQCLEILSGQQTNKRFGAILKDVKASVEGGASFLRALVVRCHMTSKRAAR